MVTALAHAYAVAGRREKALRMLEELERTSERRYVLSFDNALIHTGLGDKGQAFIWLGKAFEERSVALVFLNVDPRLDPLCSDPRYRGLLRRMNFPPEPFKT